MPNYTNYSYLTHKIDNKHNKPSGFKHTLLCYVLPFIVINLIIFYIVTAQPRYSLTVDDQSSFSEVTVSLKIKSLFPRKEVYMDIDGEPLDMDTSGSTYKSTIDNNGTLTVRVSNINGMEKTEYLHIGSIDDAPPVVSLLSDSDGHLVLSFEDTQSGVNYDAIYGLDSEGKKITPSLVDEGASSVTFNYDGLSLEVHISDKVGHESVATFGRDADVSSEPTDESSPEQSESSESEAN